MCAQMCAQLRSAKTVKIRVLDKYLILLDFIGGRTRTRTLDPLIKSKLLLRTTIRIRQLIFAPEKRNTCSRSCRLHLSLRDSRNQSAEAHIYVHLRSAGRILPCRCHAAALARIEASTDNVNADTAFLASRRSAIKSLMVGGRTRTRTLDPLIRVIGPLLSKIGGPPAATPASQTAT